MNARQRMSMNQKIGIDSIGDLPVTQFHSRNDIMLLTAVRNQQNPSQTNNFCFEENSTNAFKNATKQIFPLWFEPKETNVDFTPTARTTDGASNRK